MNTTEKKAFDPTVSFMFFGSWARTISEIKNRLGAEAACTMFEAIAEYSMYGTDPDFSDYPLLSILWPTIERQVDTSVNNRKRGFAKDEFDEKKRQAIVQAKKNNPNASLRQIAAMTGSSKSTVDRALRECAAELNVALSNSVCSKGEDTACDVDAGSGLDNDGDNDNGSDSMGRDAGQVDPLTCSLSLWRTLPEEVQKEFSIYNRIRERIMKGNCMEIDNTTGRAKWSIREWDRTYYAWLKSINTNAVEAILEKYLSTHKESTMQKKLGDKYGRIVKGWDSVRKEPIVAYSFSYLHKSEKHNIVDIPGDYYLTEEEEAFIEEECEMLLMESAEELAFEHGLSLDEALDFLRSQQEEQEDELPF